MKYVASLLLLLTLAGTAVAQTAPLILGPQSSTFDMQRMPRPGSRLVPDSPAAAAKNTLNWNAVSDSIHMAAGGIRDDVYLPAGRWYHSGPLRLGINAEGTKIRAGGRIQGAGGFGDQLNNNSISVNLGAETRLINTSTIDRTPADGFTDGASLLYGGYGWRFGNCSIWGFDIPNHDAWVDRNTKSQKQSVGLLLQASHIPGPANASFLWVAPITFMGFHDAILIQPNTGTNGQANNTYWQFIGADTCDTIFHVNDDQSVAHEIYALSPGEHCDRGIFMERGGHIHVYAMEVIYPNFTVAEIGDYYHHTYGELVIDGLKLDNLREHRHGAAQARQIHRPAAGRHDHRRVGAESASIRPAPAKASTPPTASSSASPATPRTRRCSTPSRRSTPKATT